MGVNGVNSVQQADTTKTQGPQRVVEQQEEEMFPVQEEGLKPGEIGIGTTFGDIVATTTIGAAIALSSGDKKTDANFKPGEVGIGTTVGNAVATTTMGAAINLIPDDTKAEIKDGAKSALHKTAEAARNFKQEHPVLGWFATGGVLYYGLDALDKYVNGDK